MKRYSGNCKKDTYECLTGSKFFSFLLTVLHILEYKFNVTKSHNYRIPVKLVFITVRQQVKSSKIHANTIRNNTKKEDSWHPIKCSQGAVGLIPVQKDVGIRVTFTNPPNILHYLQDFSMWTCPHILVLDKLQTIISWLNGQHRPFQACFVRKNRNTVHIYTMIDF